MRPKIKQSSLEPCRHHCRLPDGTMKSEVPLNFEGLPGVGTREEWKNIVGKPTKKPVLGNAGTT